MDFDEIDYLEKMLENPNSLEVNETANGIDGGSADKSGANEGSRRSSKHQRDEMGASFDRRSKRVKRGDEAHDGQRHTERSSGQPRLSSRDGERGEKDRHRSSREHRVQGRYYRDRDQQKEWQRGHNRNRRLQDREREGRGRHHQSEKEKGESEREGEKETEDSRQSGSNTERPRSRDNREDSERIQGGDFKEKEKEKELRDNTNRYARAIFRSSLWQLCQAQELRSWVSMCFLVSQESINSCIARLGIAIVGEMPMRE